MDGWNTTDFNWESVSTFYNAPPGLLLDDLLAAATERWNTFSDDEISVGVGDNSPLKLGTYADIFGSLLFGDNGARFMRPVSEDSYDYTNESSILYWDMASLVSELGPVPDYGKSIEIAPGLFFPSYENNAPVTAEWCQWWYKAINKLVRSNYSQGLMQTMLGSYKDYSGTGETYAEAKSSWAAKSWTEPAAGPGDASQSAEHTGGGFDLRRERSITDQATYQWQPHLYTHNYTLSVWGRFGASFSYVYDNPDYPCDRNTYAKIFDDTSVQSGVYDKDVKFGYFDTITAEEPENFDRRFWSSGTLSNHCRFDIEDGFEYVAPEE